MKPRDKLFIVNALKLFDMAAMVVAFILAATIPYMDIGTVPFSEFLTVRIKVQNFLLFSAFLMLWHAMFSHFGLYTLDRVARGGHAEALDIVKAALCGTLAILAVKSIISIELITVGSLAVFLGAACLNSLGGRMVLRAFLRHRPRSANDLSQLVIVGTNARAIAFAKRIEANPESGYRLVGFVDEQWFGEKQFREAGYTVVSDFNGFESFLKDQVVDEVIICAPIRSLYDRSSKILAQCEQQGVTVRFVSDLFTPTIGRSTIERFEEHTVVTVDTGGMTGGAVWIKRLLDLSASLALLVMLSPLLLAIALLIKVASPGPALFVQERVGLNKRRFRLYKFRTMVVDAEQRLAALEDRNEVSGPVFKIERDPRITRIGALLRKTSLDELPQLINVFKGDMSLVGPRPLPVRDYRGFTQHWHRRRFSVRPGITCLWQVYGRNSIPFERWMELDMQYIDQWSLLLDMKILLRTIPAVVKGSGAS